MKEIKDCRLYAISSIPKGGMSYSLMAREAVSGGADAFQLRAKELTDREMLRQACEIAGICRELGSVFILNDRVDIAVACGADGVHLGQDDMPITDARKILGPGKIIGCSTHSVEQACQAEADGADYIGVGPIYATPTKPDYKAVGLELIEAVSRKVKIPFTAIGGINLDNAAGCLKAGVRMIAVVRAVCGERDIRKNAGLFRELIDEVLNGKLDRIA